MTRVAVPKMRSTFSDTPEGLEVVIPVRRNPFLTLFLGAWLLGWGFGELAAFHDIVSGGKAWGERSFGVFFLIAWTIAGGFALFAWMWMAAGRERVRLSAAALVIRREVFGVGQDRDYDLAHVQNLRVAASSFNPFDLSAGLYFWGLGGGLLAFDYGAKTIRFGAAVEEAEARLILERFTRRHPFPGATSVA